MEMTAVIEQLQQLGFSQYEAQAYVALLKESPANGYELAKRSGIPRPNIYPVIQKLEKRGAVLRVDAPEGTRYMPVAPHELLSGLKQQYQGTLEAAASALTEVAASTHPEYILNLRGYAMLLEHAQRMIQSAQCHLLLSLWPEEAVALAEPIQQAEERGVEITTLCLKGCPHPCRACRGAIFRYPLAPASQNRWLVLVQDSREVLAGEISPQQETLAVRSQQQMLVNVSASYIQNSIALASILSGLGDRLDTLLDPQTLIALNTLHPLQAQGRWLDVMRRMIFTEENIP
jgi:HTH-type transcriptional regulator, sugar sensing transcriptional regulator